MRPILYMLISCLFYSIMTAIGKFLITDLNGYMIVLLRNSSTFLLCSFLVISKYKEAQSLIFSKKIWLRAILSQSATTFWFVGLTYNALPFATSVSLSTPLFTTLAAAFLLGEVVSFRRWISLFIGFFGVLLITLSNYKGGFDLNFLWIIGAVISWALANIVAKKLSESISPTVIIFFMMALMTLFSIPLAIINWITPLTYTIPWFIAMAISTFLWQWFLIHAFSQSEVAMLQPFELSKLLFASLIGWLVFNETLSIMGWVGALVIAISTCYITWKERKKSLTFNGTEL